MSLRKNILRRIYIPIIPNAPAACKECGGTDLTWPWQPKNLGGAVDGRLRMHEIGVTFFLGCDSCSETLLTVDGDKIAAQLTRIQAERPKENPGIQPESQPQWALYRPNGTIIKVYDFDELTPKREAQILGDSWPEIKEKDDFRAGTPYTEAADKARRLGYQIRAELALTETLAKTHIGQPEFQKKYRLQTA